MIYASMIVMIAAFAFLPWWTLIFISAIAGGLAGRSKRHAARFGLAAGLVWAALAVFRDGQNFGLISRRMAGAFALPVDQLIFVVVAGLGFMTAFLCFQCGAAVVELFKENSENI